MKNLDNQARSNVLKQLIAMMGESMANRKQKSALQIEIKPSNSSDELTDEDCPHCDGDGCRFCG
jgi:hypothetical protein